jgi:hypothetical protein
LLQNRWSEDAENWGEEEEIWALVWWSLMWRRGEGVSMEVAMADWTVFQSWETKWDSVTASFQKWICVQLKWSEVKWSEVKDWGFFI